MAEHKGPHIENRVQEHRLRRDWSQTDLANRAGLSRAGISAIEMNRLVPSTAAALALAAAFECRVEDLFCLPGAETISTAWAWAPNREPCRYWQAVIGGRKRLYPVEASPAGLLPHDGVFRDGTFQDRARHDPADTLVLASCDPAAGLLAAELARAAGVRLIVLSRSSRQALTLLGQGLVHVAGVHLARAKGAGGNIAAVRGQIGAGYQLLRMASWEEGVAFGTGLKLGSIRAASSRALRWVGREEGSGARQCLDEILAGRRPPRRIAADHRGVAEAVRGGWADAGVCLRLVSEEAGLGFLSVRHEAYDLCFAATLKNDRRLRALVQLAHSASFRRSLGELPGYDSAETGELIEVK